MEPLPIEAKRLKSLRDDLGLSQIEFAEKVGLKTTADIERGKTRITGYIVKELLKQFQINPLWLYGESKKKYLQTDVLPKMISDKPSTKPGLSSPKTLIKNDFIRTYL